MQKKNFNLENSPYKEEHIIQAIEDFGEDFTLDYRANMLSITGDNLEEIQTIFDEFMNYVLALSNEQI